MYDSDSVASAKTLLMPLELFVSTVHYSPLVSAMYYGGSGASGRAIHKYNLPGRWRVQLLVLTRHLMKLSLKHAMLIDVLNEPKYPMYLIIVMVLDYLQMAVLVPGKSLWRKLFFS